MYSGIVVKIFDPDPTNVENNLARIQELMTARTKVIQVSHVTAPTGIRLPVAAIGKLAHEAGIWFHIDGAQSLGMFPIRISDLNCDSFAACGHKWMCGPLGTGILFVRHERQNEVQPTEVGSYADAEWGLPAKLVLVDTARRFECGTRDSATVVGFVETIKFLAKLEIAKIAAHGDELSRFLHKRLSENPKLSVLSPSLADLRSSIVSFSVEGQSCDDIFGRLLRAGFRCRPVRERDLNAVRISAHLFNTQGECERLIDAINAL
jgi:selenocysteine lyase/cysteine desulfurase